MTDDTTSAVREADGWIRASDVENARHIVTEELNPSNYDHETVFRLNSMAEEMDNELQRLIQEATPTPTVDAGTVLMQALWHAPSPAEYAANLAQAADYEVDATAWVIADYLREWRAALHAEGVPYRSASATPTPAADAGAIQKAAAIVDNMDAYTRLVGGAPSDAQFFRWVDELREALTTPPEAEAGAGEPCSMCGKPPAPACALCNPAADGPTNGLIKPPAPEAGEPKPPSVFDQAMNTAPAMLARMQAQPGTDALRKAVRPVLAHMEQLCAVGQRPGISLIRDWRDDLRAALDAGEVGK